MVSQIRVGGMAARERDEQLGREFGLIGQETVGVGGFANALRTIPVALDIATDVARHAPDAMLLNFTNPAGLVTEAICRYGDVPAIGLCNVPWTVKAQVARSLGVEADCGRLRLRRAEPPQLVPWRHVDGADRTGEVLDGLRQRVDEAGDGDRSRTGRRTPSTCSTPSRTTTSSTTTRPTPGCATRPRIRPGVGGDGHRGRAAHPVRRPDVDAQASRAVRARRRLLLRGRCGTDGRPDGRRRHGPCREHSRTAARSRACPTTWWSRCRHALVRGG